MTNNTLVPFNYNLINLPNIIQYGMMYIFQFLQQIDRYKIAITKKTMQNLLALQTQGNLLQLNPSNNSFNHLIICDSIQNANHTVQSYISANRECVTLGDVSENIVKLEVSCVGLMGIFQKQIQKVIIIKQILNKMQQKCNKNVNLSEGFYYINACTKKIQFYTVNLNNSTTNQNNTSNILEIFAIFVYLLDHSTDIKDYVTAWKRICINKSQFKPTLKNNNKIDQFLLSILNKQIVTTKIAHHTIEILIQKINWVKNIPGQPTPIKQKNLCSTNYADFKLNLNPTAMKSTGRLKHSNSMTSLNSTSKARKYKQVSKHAKKQNEKFIKQRQFRNESFKNTNQSINFQPNSSSQSFVNSKVISKMFEKSTKNTFFGSLKLKQTATRQNWYKQDKAMESFAQVNQQCMQSSISAQNQLMDLLETKNKIKKVNQQENYEAKCCEENVSMQALRNGQRILNPKKQLKFCHQNINVKVQGTKRRVNLRFVPEIFSHNVVSFNTGLKLKQNSQSQVQVMKKQIPNSYKLQRENLSSISQISERESVHFGSTNKTLSLKSQVKPIQPEHNEVQNQEASQFDKNSTFIYQAIKEIAADSKENRLSWIISMYTLSLFYYLCCYPSSDYQLEQMQKHIEGIKYLGEIILKRKDTSGRIKSAYEKDITGDLNYLVNLSIDVPTVQNIKPQHSNCQKKVQRVLKNQTTLLMDEVKKNKNQIMEKNKLKSHILGIMRVAVVINVSKNLQKQNDLIKQFGQYQKAMLDQNRTQYSISVDEEFKNMNALL